MGLAAAVAAPASLPVYSLRPGKKIGIVGHEAIAGVTDKTLFVNWGLQDTRYLQDVPREIQALIFMGEFIRTYPRNYDDLCRLARVRCIVIMGGEDWDANWLTAWVVGHTISVDGSLPAVARIADFTPLDPEAITPKQYSGKILDNDEKKELPAQSRANDGGAEGVTAGEDIGSPTGAGAEVLAGGVVGYSEPAVSPVILEEYGEARSSIEAPGEVSADISLEVKASDSMELEDLVPHEAAEAPASVAEEVVVLPKAVTVAEEAECAADESPELPVADVVGQPAPKKVGSVKRASRRPRMAARVKKSGPKVAPKRSSRLSKGVWAGLPLPIYPEDILRFHREQLNPNRKEKRR